MSQGKKEQVESHYLQTQNMSILIRIAAIQGLGWVPLSSSLIFMMSPDISFAGLEFLPPHWRRSEIHIHSKFSKIPTGVGEKHSK